MFRSASLKKVTGLFVALIYTTGQVALGSSLQSNIWSERKKSFQMARLPSVESQLSPVHLINRNPVPASTLSKISKFKLVHPELKSLLASLPQNIGSIRRVSIPSKPNGQTIIHLQDIHQNEEAQRNIELAVQALLNNRKVELVALEGAMGSIEIEKFRTFPDKNAVLNVVEYLKEKGRLTGPVAAGFTSATKTPQFVGIDDAAHYQANIDAFLDTRSLKESSVNALIADKAKLEQMKKEIFNEQLADFDAQVMAYRENKIDLGSYITVLSNRVSDHTAQTKLFLEAYDLEKKLDFKQVERERAALLSKLTEKLTQDELSDLMSSSLAYRLGRVAHADFYSYLRDLCTENNVSLARHPAMNGYLQYLLFSESIDVEKLLDEVKQMEDAVYASLSKSAEEKELIAFARQLYLERKLVEFALSPKEWGEYKSMDRSPWTIGQHLLTFEKFYVEAETRDIAMAENTLALLKKDKKSVAILVAGGFHAPGITQKMMDAGVTVVSFIPKVTKVEVNGESKYLSFFAQEKTPLEKLFEGTKLFVSPPPAPGPVDTEVTMAAQYAGPGPSAPTRFFAALRWFRSPLARGGRLTVRSIGGVLRVAYNGITVLFRFNGKGRLASMQEDRRLLARAVPVVAGYVRRFAAVIFVAVIANSVRAGEPVSKGLTLLAKTNKGEIGAVLLLIVVAILFVLAHHLTSHAGSAQAGKPSNNPFDPLIKILRDQFVEELVLDSDEKKEEFAVRMQPMVQSWVDENINAIAAYQNRLQRPGEGEYSKDQVVYAEPQSRFWIVYRQFTGNGPIFDDTSKIGLAVPVTPGMFEEIYTEGAEEENWVSLNDHGTHPLTVKKVVSLERSRRLIHRVREKGGMVEIHFNPPPAKSPRYVPHASGDGRYYRSEATAEELTAPLSHIVSRNRWSAHYEKKVIEVLQEFGSRPVLTSFGWALPASDLLDVMEKFPHSILWSDGQARALFDFRGNHSDILSYCAQKKLETARDFDPKAVEVSVNSESGVATIKINRPSKRNALNSDVKYALYQTVRKLEQDTNVKSMVITGAEQDGMTKAFSGGGDLEAMAALQAAGGDGEEAVRLTQMLFRTIEMCPKPIVGALNGMTFGGGNELSIATHYRVAANEATFAQTEIRLGLIPGASGTQRLTRLIGPRNALLLGLTGDAITANKALEIGLVDEVVDSTRLLERAQAVAQLLAEFPDRKFSRSNSDYFESWKQETSELGGDPYVRSLMNENAQRTPARTIAAEKILTAIVHGAESFWGEAGEAYEAQLFGEILRTEECRACIKGFLSKTYKPEPVSLSPEALKSADTKSRKKTMQTKIPERVIRGMRRVVKDLEYHWKQAEQRGGLSQAAREIFKNGIELRRTIIEGMNSQTEIHLFLVTVARHHPIFFQIDWAQFENLWDRLLKADGAVRGAAVVRPFSVADKLNAVLADKVIRQMWASTLSRPVASTSPTRYSIEDRILKRLLAEYRINEPKALDRGASSMVTSENLDKAVGREVVPMDLQSDPQPYVTGSMLALNQTRHIPVSAKVKNRFRQGDMTEAYFNDLEGDLAVIRDAGVRQYLSGEQVKKAVGHVFRYVKGTQNGLLYHTTHGSSSRRTLFGSLIYRITGSNPKDWTLEHAGVIHNLGGKDRSLSISDDEHLAQESALSERIISIRGRLLSMGSALARGQPLDEYGRLTPELQNKIVNSLFPSRTTSEEDDILKHLLHDIAVISPWTHEPEFNGNYYEEKNVLVPNELDWKFVQGPKYNLDDLLETLERRLSSPLAKLAHVEQSDLEAAHQRMIELGKEWLRLQIPLEGERMENGLEVHLVTEPEGLRRHGVDPDLVKHEWKEHAGIVVLKHPLFKAFACLHHPLPFQGRMKGAIGGVRNIFPEKIEFIVIDGLGLSGAMTPKTQSLADDEHPLALPLGGSKFLIFSDPNAPEEIREQVYEAVGRFLHRYDLDFVGTDSNTTPKLLRHMARFAPDHVYGIQETPGRGLEASPNTAEGVYRGMLGALKAIHGPDAKFNGRLIKLSGGGGDVATTLIKRLLADGARIVISEKLEKKWSDILARYEGRISTIDKASDFNPEELKEGQIILLKDTEGIYDVPGEIFSPNALGRFLNETNIARLKASGTVMVAGAANTALATPQDGVRVHEGGIIYVPDFVINAGGVTAVFVDLFGLKMKDIFDKIEKACFDIVKESLDKKVPTATIAEKKARQRLLITDYLLLPDAEAIVAQLRVHKQARANALGLVQYHPAQKRTLAQVVEKLEADFAEVDFSNGITERQMEALNEILASLDANDPEMQNLLKLDENQNQKNGYTAVSLLPHSFNNKSLRLWAAGYPPEGGTAIHAHDSREYLYEAYVPLIGDNGTDEFTVQDSREVGGKNYVRLARLRSVVQKPNDGQIYQERQSRQPHRNYNPTQKPSWVALVYVRDIKRRGPITSTYSVMSDKEMEEVGLEEDEPWYRYNPAPTTAPASMFGRNYVWSVILEQFLFSPVTFTVLLLSWVAPGLDLPFLADRLYLVLLPMIDFGLVFVTRFIFVWLHGDRAFIAARDVNWKLGKPFTRKQFDDSLKFDFVIYVFISAAVNLFGLLVFGYPLGWQDAKTFEMVRLVLTDTFVASYLVGAVIHFVQDKHFFDQARSNEDEHELQILGDNLIRAAKTLAEKASLEDVPSEVIGELVRLNIGKLYQQPADVSYVDPTKLARYVEAKLKNDVEKRGLSPALAQQLVQQISQWIGHPMAVDTISSAVFVIRASDLNETNLANAFRRLPNDARIEIVMDENEAAEITAALTGPQKRKVEFRSVPNLFSNGNQINTVVLGGQLENLALRYGETQFMLVYSKELVYDDLTFASLSPARLKQFDFISLEDLSSNLFGLAKLLPLDVLLDLARVLSTNA